MVIDNIEVSPQVLRDALREVTGQWFDTSRREGLVAAEGAVVQQAEHPESARALAQAIARCSSIAYTVGKEAPFGEVSLRTTSDADQATAIFLDDAPSESSRSRASVTIETTTQPSGRSFKRW